MWWGEGQSCLSRSTCHKLSSHYSPSASSSLQPRPLRREGLLRLMTDKPYHPLYFFGLSCSLLDTSGSAPNNIMCNIMCYCNALLSIYTSMVLNSHLDLVPCLTNAFLFISPCPLLQIIDLSRVHEETGLEYDQCCLKSDLLLLCASENANTQKLLKLNLI